MSRHAQARELATAAFAAVFSRAPSLPEVQHLQGIGALETSYGFGWSIPEAVGSNNVGAIIAGSWQGETFEHRDSMPEDDGTSTWYTTKFRKYPTLLAGWTDLARVMYRDRPSVLTAATAGDTFGVSSALYHTEYFFGFGATVKERIGRHHRKLAECIAAQCRALGETLPGGAQLPPRTLRRGMHGDDVRELQRFLGSLVADGMFGGLTDKAVRVFQSTQGLTVDGVVGEQTWARIDQLDTIS